MVSKVATTQKRKWPEKVLIAGTLIVFFLLAGKHYELSYAFVPETFDSLKRRAVVLVNTHGLLNTCPAGEEFTAISGDEYLCGQDVADLEWPEIYLTYPLSAHGREAAYKFLNQGDSGVAASMLNDVYDLERYEPVEIPNVTWTEDPFEERYWRFLFYSLRPTRHLLDTALVTGDDRYYDKFTEILGSFLEDGMDKEHSWNDYHGVAFRTMSLVNSWWKLREAGRLTEELSDDILSSLVVHGNFLLEDTHYEGGNNHGITQATALLVLAENFPDLPGARVWGRVARERLEDGLDTLVDEDGVLVENSPYYHYYVLEKYWEIYRYIKEYDIEIGSDFEDKITRMIDHAKYITLPDNNIPLMGASIPRTLQSSGEIREIAAEDEEFRFVISQGRRGKRPERQSIAYDSSGLITMRSGWGEERPYEEESVVVFDIGPYRTDHSDFDVLNFIFFTEGDRIIRDTGLYTYEADNEFLPYFHGTRGHNTVMVDNQDQPEGTAIAGVFREGDGYVYQTALHTLYDGVIHRRGVALIENDVVVVVDDLESNEVHDYDQILHLDSETIVNRNGLMVNAETRDEDVHFTIRQFLDEGLFLQHDEGDEEGMRGLCAVAYEVFVPCPEITYSKQAEDARFVTVITVDDGLGNAPDVVYDEETNVMTITTNEGVHTVSIEFPEEGRGAEGHIVLAIDSEQKTRSILEKIRSGIQSAF